MPLFKVSIQEVYADESGPRDVSDVTKQSQGTQTLGEVLAEAIAACSVEQKYLLVAEMILDLDRRGHLTPWGIGDDDLHEYAIAMATAADDVLQRYHDWQEEGDEGEDVPEGMILPIDGGEAAA